MPAFNDRRPGVKPRRGKVYTYEPTGLDAWDPKPHQPKPGDPVRVMHPGQGAPPNGTMGMTYVEHATTGEFHGLVNQNSLKPVPSSAVRKKKVE